MNHIQTRLSGKLAGVLAVTILSFSCKLVGEVRFEILGTFGGRTSQALGVSGDGSTIVGYAQNESGNRRAFIYKEGTLTDLGTLGGIDSIARAANADGSVVVGFSKDSSGTDRAFQYDGTQLVDLGTLGGGRSRAARVSGDGSVIVGEAETSSGDVHAFLHADNSMMDLGTLGGTYSRALDVSADGSIVVGEAETAFGETHAFLYEEQTMKSIGTLGGAYSRSSGVSADGSVVVGMAETLSGDTRAFIYDGKTMSDLGYLNDHENDSEARDVSSDGVIIIGDGFRRGSTITSKVNSQPVIWSGFLENGLNSPTELNSFLEDAGVNLGSSRIINIWEISDNGDVIVGDVSSSDFEGIRGFILRGMNSIIRKPTSTWCGFTKTGPYVDTASWLGWLYVDEQDSAGYVYSYLLDKFVFIPDCPEPGGGWVWVPDT
jgi:probable HAF family extracellular repeat protein